MPLLLSSPKCPINSVEAYHSAAEKICTILASTAIVRVKSSTGVAGALGLILPGLLRIRPMLTPLAACGLVIELICATIYTVIGGQGAGDVLPLVLGLLCAFVAYGRRSWATR